MHTTAAILEKTGTPLVLDEIEIPILKPGQVLVEIRYTAICHTQLHEVRGRRGEDRFLPHCLGHEGSGVILKVGSDVKKVEPGDFVILSWMKGDGADVPGTQYQWKDRKVNAGGITTFAHHAVLSENRVVKIPDGFDLKKAALLGCAVPTGLGAVFNVAKPKPGDSIAIFGCGGIGLCALQAAKVAGCETIIALDIFDKKLEEAKKLGATHTINVKRENAIEAISKITSLDIAIEASGHPQAMKDAIYSVRPRGGKCVVIGNAPFGQMLEIDPLQFNLGKSILGTWGGDNEPDRDFPKYCQMIDEGKIVLNSFIEGIYSLQSINEALNDLEQGLCFRPLIDLNR